MPQPTVLGKAASPLRPPSDNDAKIARQPRPPTLQEYEYDLQRVMGAHQPTTCKPTSATRAFARLDIRRMECPSLNKPCQRTGDGKPQAGGGDYRLHQEASNVARIMHEFKWCQAQRVLGNSPPSSKGDGWGVGRGRQVFCPVTFPCPPQPQSDLHSIFLYQTIQGIYQRDQQSPSRKGVLEYIYPIGIMESQILD